MIFNLTALHCCRSAVSAQSWSVLINIIMSDTDSGIESALSKLPDDTKLSSTVDMTEGQDVIQRPGQAQEVG